MKLRKKGGLSGSATMLTSRLSGLFGPKGGNKHSREGKGAETTSAGGGAVASETSGKRESKLLNRMSSMFGKKHTNNHGGGGGGALPQKEDTGEETLSHDERLAILMRAGSGEITIDQAMKEMAFAESIAMARSPSVSPDKASGK